jgi:hypothetical protein
MSGEGNPEHPYRIYPDHDYYNPLTDSWHRLENMPIAIHGGGTAVGGSSGLTIQLLDAIDRKIIDGAGKIVSAKCRLQ